MRERRTNWPSARLLWPSEAPKSWPKQLPEDVNAAQEAAKLRAAAVVAVTNAAAKLSGSASALSLRHLEHLAFVLEDGSPALGAGHAAAFGAARGRVAADRKLVVGSLLRLAVASSR